MKKTTLLISFLITLNAYSQITPGLIVEPATGAGRIVLDPNLDGYTSASTAGFTVNDLTSSEIPFKSITLISEPSGDLSAGPTCNYTDFVTSAFSTVPNGAGYYYLDANNNWIFRLRTGSYSPNKKSYSVLIDIDGKFGNTGPNADAQYVLGNPGFEIEILLGTGNGVYVYDVNNNTNTSVLKRSYTVTTNYQKSKALSAVCTSTDFFLDFFVPFGDIIADFTSLGLTSTSTPLRFAIGNNMSANRSTIGNLSSISDILGVSGSNNEIGLIALINAMAPTCAACTPGLLRSDCPFISGPILSNATSVSGTGTNGDTIKLYVDGVRSGSPVLVSGGVWSVSGLSDITNGKVVGASATTPGKSESINNCNNITVAACGVVPVPTAMTPTIRCVTGTGVNGSIIQVYENNVLVTASATTWSGSTFTWLCTSAADCSSGGPGCLGNSASFRVFQIIGGCSSDGVCMSNGTVTTTSTPSITTPSITAATTSVTGNCVSGATVFLYADGTQIGTVTGTTTWTINSLTLSVGQVLTARAILTNQCLSSASVARTVTRSTTNPPIITSAGCGTITIVSGTCSEASGTVVQVYDNGVPAGATVTVDVSGNWSRNGLSIVAGRTITARATISGGTISAASNSITVGTQSSQTLTVSGAYTSASTAVTGTGTNGDIIKLYVDGFYFGQTTVTSSAWSISVIAGLDLFQGVIITATNTTGTNCESIATTGITVTCVAPTAITVTQTINTCNGYAVISITNTENGVLYQLYNGSNPYGPGVIGTGGTVTVELTSVTSALSLTAKATNITSETCVNNMTGTISIGLAPADSTWYGTFNTNWFDSRNWCLQGAIPTATTKAKISTGAPFYPNINANGAVCDTLILYSGSSITTSTTQNLDIYGGWENNGGTYTPNSGTVTFRGTGAVYIGGTTATTFNNLTLNITGTLGNDLMVINMPTTVTGLLTLTDGRINTTTTNILALTSTATSSAGNGSGTISFVNGPMTKEGNTAFIFPVGSGTIYGPIGIQTPSSSATFQAQYFNSGYSNTSSMATSPTPVLQYVSAVEYWSLTQPTGAASLSVQMFWQNATSSYLDNISCSDLREARWNGTAWENVDNSNTIPTCPSSTNTGSITNDNALSSSSFSSGTVFTFGTIGTTPLPIKLISFSGKYENQNVVLSWETASEINNSHFVIERGINNLNFIPIANVQGAGNSNQILNYQFIDKDVTVNNMPDAIFYYRLKQIDYNGGFEYSNFISVKKYGKYISGIILYPNPSNGKVRVINHNNEINNIEIYNSVGQVVYSCEITNTDNDISFNLPNGMYYYFLKNRDELIDKGKIIVEN